MWSVREAASLIQAVKLLGVWGDYHLEIPECYSIINKFLFIDLHYKCELGKAFNVLHLASKIETFTIDHLR